MPDLAIAAALSFLFSALNWAIDLKYRSSASLRMCLSGSGLLYFLVLLTGNTATTLLAGATTRAVFTDSATLESQQSIKQFVLSFPWFWYAFLGVFGFSAVLKNMNLTFFRQGVLSINDWISKARAHAVASAVKAQAAASAYTAQQRATKIRALPEADLNAHVLNALGATRLRELERSARATGADAPLVKALALAYEAPNAAAAL